MRDRTAARVRTVAPLRIPPEGLRAPRRPVARGHFQGGQSGVLGQGGRALPSFTVVVAAAACSAAAAARPATCHLQIRLRPGGGGGGGSNLVPGGGTATVSGGGPSVTISYQGEGCWTSAKGAFGTKCRFLSTGSQDTFVVPAGVSSLHVVATGAPGGVGS